jgi:hypothetical protein
VSVILAIRSTHAVVVAADSQRVSSAGTSEAPHQKVLHVGRSTVGAFAGLLEFSGKDTASHIHDPTTVGNVNPTTGIELIAAHLTPLLEDVDESEVAFLHRRLDVILASRREIASVGFFPERDTHSIRVERAANGLWLVAGANAAAKAARERLSRETDICGLRRNMLRHLANSVTDAAIAAGGPHQYWPDMAACCLPVRLLSIP